MPDTMPAERIAAVRQFNRFYTQHIGVLQEAWLDSPFSLTQARVLYEIITRKRSTATELGNELGLDAGYLSRMLRNFEKRGLIRREVSKTDARQSFLSVTARGQETFGPLEKHSNTQVRASLERLAPRDQARLVEAMRTVAGLLGAPVAKQRSYHLREPRHGDFGWIVTRHAELYAQEYGWVEPFEGLCAQIVADFVNNCDPKFERCWIAELDGENVGCVMVVKDKPGVARLRLLLVDPKGRGLGIGTRLVDECVRFARQAGYKKMTLWTHSILKAARHLYEQAGFTLTSSEKRRSWGKDVVAEFWDLKL